MAPQTRHPILWVSGIKPVPRFYKRMHSLMQFLMCFGLKNRSLFLRLRLGLVSPELLRFSNKSLQRDPRSKSCRTWVESKQIKRGSLRPHPKGRKAVNHPSLLHLVQANRCQEILRTRRLRNLEISILLSEVKGLTAFGTAASTPLDQILSSKISSSSSTIHDRRPFALARCS